MKLKHGLFIFVFGWIGTTVGALFKLESFPAASEILMLGAVLNVVGLVLIIYKLATLLKLKGFLNQ